MNYMNHFGMCGYDCENKNEFGHCKLTGCVYPEYSFTKTSNGAGTTREDYNETKTNKVYIQRPHCGQFIEFEINIIGCKTGEYR